jgi:hypothetical protein
MSAALERSRVGYYEALQSITSKEILAISWIRWFLDALGNAVGEALLPLHNVILKDDFWQTHAQSGPNLHKARSPPAARCELSLGCPFGADLGDWSYHTSDLQDRSE